MSKMQFRPSHRTSSNPTRRRAFPSGRERRRHETVAPGDRGASQPMHAHARHLSAAVRAVVRLRRGRRVWLPISQPSGSATSTLAPVFAARPGSSHGYDVIDPTAAQPRARRRGRLPRDGGRLSPPRPGPHPRHRAEPHGDRRRQQSLLARRAALGPRQPLAGWFDIDWNAPTRPRRQAAAPGPRRELSAGARRRARSSSGSTRRGQLRRLGARRHKLPVSPRSYGCILRAGGLVELAAAAEALGERRPRRSRLGALGRRLAGNPAASEAAAGAFRGAPTTRRPGTGSMR